MSAYKDKKTGKWCAHVRYTDWQGEARRKLKRGFKTKREALAWEREFLASASGDLTMTLGEFVRAYEEDRRPRLKLNTWITKDYIIKDKILPYFANKPMNEIGPRDIVKWQNAVMREGERSGRPYSQTYLKTIQNQLTAIFSHAVRYYGLRVNPAAKAGSMGKKRANEMRFWTLEQYSRFAEEAMEEPRAYYAFEVLYWCGPRVGELLALQPSDIDLQSAELSITKSLQRLKGEDVITDPKTAKGVRAVSMPARLVEEMEQYTALFYEIGPHDRLFPVSKSYLGARLKRYAARAGLEPIRVHDLRHSHVSLLIDQGFTAVAIADRVGHESAEITYTYAHLFPNAQADMAERLDVLMGGGHGEGERLVA